jgi:hypothetical protein
MISARFKAKLWIPLQGLTPRSTQGFKAFGQGRFQRGEASRIQTPKAFAQSRDQGFGRGSRRGGGWHFCIIPDDVYCLALAAGFATGREPLDQAAAATGISLDPVSVMAIAALIRSAQEDAPVKIDDEFMVRPLHEVLTLEYAHAAFPIMNQS